MVRVLLCWTGRVMSRSDRLEVGDQVLELCLGKWFAREFFGTVMLGQNVFEAVGTTVVQEATFGVQSPEARWIELGIEHPGRLQPDLVGRRGGEITATVAVDTAGDGFEELFAPGGRCGELSVVLPVRADGELE